LPRAACVPPSNLQYLQNDQAEIAWVTRLKTPIPPGAKVSSSNVEAVQAKNRRKSYSNDDELPSRRWAPVCCCELLCGVAGTGPLQHGPELAVLQDAGNGVLALLHTPPAPPAAAIVPAPQNLAWAADAVGGLRLQRAGTAAGGAA